MSDNSDPTFYSSLCRPMVQTGSIELIIGPMFSGKTTELMRRIKRHSIAKRKCIILKYNKDVRYSTENLSTHDLLETPALPVSRLYEAAEAVRDADVIGIDEGQFYVDLIQFCEEQANKGKIVIVSALDANYKRERFNDVVDLIPKCESVEKLNAVCTMCGGIASFSMRIVEDKSLELVGGADKYTAVCRRCYFKCLGKNKSEEMKSPSPVLANPNSPPLEQDSAS